MNVNAVVFDVNGTLSDLSVLRESFVEFGLAANVAESWFAATLRAPERVDAGDPIR